MTAEVGKILKSVQCDITFTFIELSETPNSFVKLPVVLEIRNGASFTKTYLSWKRDFTKTRKNTKKLHASRNYKLVIVVFMPTSPFSNKEKKFGVHFSNVICTKTRPWTLLLFIWKLITLTLFFVQHEVNDNVLSPWCPTMRPFFLGIRFFSGLGSGAGCGF